MTTADYLATLREDATEADILRHCAALLRQRARQAYAVSPMTWEGGLTGIGPRAPQYAHIKALTPEFAFDLTDLFEDASYQTLWDGHRYVVNGRALKAAQRYLGIEA